ncbi:MAG: ATPase [Lachnospiraceae bacterium]|nr:ATPase [Lachnospiraceae bacterium]
MTVAEQTEKSIQKTFHKKLFTPFAKAINAYELLSPGDHVAVCISGGKDSFLMAKLFQELKRHRKFDFSLTFLCMDPGYNQDNRVWIEENARLLEVPVQFFASDIFAITDSIDENPCYLCARMRRGHLYAKAKEAGCNKIALGHHFNDVIETTLMGMLYGAQMQTMMPKIRSANFEGMELIRPMYLIREEDILRFWEVNGLAFIRCACRMTEHAGQDGEGIQSDSKRFEIKRLIAELKKTNPYVESNIFNSTQNVNLGTILAYKQDGVRHSFLEWYQ